MSPLIVVACPAGAVTGGPEALHQLSSMANEVEDGISAICYAPFESSHSTPEPYVKYGCKIIKKEDIPQDAIVVLPEIWAHLISSFEQRCAFWWLSVDHFVSQSYEVLDNVVIHLAQSEYARDHIDKSLKKQALMLTDYINTDFYEDITCVKKPRVAVNPAKGKDLIESFRSIFSGIEIIELTGMDRQTLKQEMSNSSLFIDFGHHPGRDRLPRESALCKTVLMSRRIGSACNSIDMPIDEWYKFDDVAEVGEKAMEIINNNNYHVAAQSFYLENILKQRDYFKTEVSNLIHFAKTGEIKND